MGKHCRGGTELSWSQAEVALQAVANTA